MSGLARTLCVMHASYHAAPCDSDRLCIGYRWYIRLLPRSFVLVAPPTLFIVNDSLGTKLVVCGLLVCISHLASAQYVLYT